MNYSSQEFSEFLREIPGFEKLSPAEINHLLSKQQALRYRLGQKIIGKEQLPERIVIVYQGKVRLLGYHPQSQLPITLKMLEPGAVIGEISYLRQIACETAIASTEVICLTWNPVDYLSVFSQNSDFAKERQEENHIIEVFDVISHHVAQKAYGNLNLKDITRDILPESKIQYLPPGKTPLDQLGSDRIWFVSSGQVTNFPVNSQIVSGNNGEVLQVTGKSPARLLGISPQVLLLLEQQENKELEKIEDPWGPEDVIDIPFAPKTEFAPQENRKAKSRKKTTEISFFWRAG